MYPRDNYDNNYNPYEGYGGYPPNDDMARSMQGGDRPPRPPPRNSYNTNNNPSVGPGESQFTMPMGPSMGGGGFGSGFSGGPPAGPGGFVFDQPPGAGPPANRSGGGYPPNGYNGGGGGGGGYPPTGYNSGGYPPSSPPYGGPGFGGSYPPPFGGPGMGGPSPPFGGPGMSPPPFGGPGMGPPPCGRPGMGPPPASAGMRQPPASAGMRPPTGSQETMGRPSPRPMNGSAPELGGGSRPQSEISQSAPSTSSGPKPSAYRPSQNAQRPPQGAASNANRGLYWNSMGPIDPQSSQLQALPPGAIRAGSHKGENFYVGRSRVSDGSMQAGMVLTSKGGVIIAYNGKVNVYRHFEVLCGPESAVKWVAGKGRFDPNEFVGKARPFVCGKESSGEPVYYAICTHRDRAYGGRVSAKVKGMMYSCKGSEEREKNYHVLCQIS